MVRPMAGFNIFYFILIRCVGMMSKFSDITDFRRSEDGMVCAPEVHPLTM